MDHSTRIRHLVNRYLNNSCTRQEMDELMDYLRENPEGNGIDEVLKRFWTNDRPSANDNGLSWADLHKRIRDRKIRDIGLHGGGMIWKAAACILLLITAYCGFYFFSPSTVTDGIKHESLANKAIEAAGREHRLTVLPDGSKVWINSRSRIDVCFTAATREVRLSGEAYFDIHRETDRPFIIKTGEVKTTVLGTAFNIRAFPEEHEVTVTVTRGVVKVESKDENTSTLTANQQIRLDLKLHKVVAETIEAAEVTKWITDDLILQEVTLDEVGGIIEDRFDVELVFNNPRLKECRFTTTLVKNASLTEVLTAICLVNHASFQTKGKRITIYGEGCAANGDVEFGKQN